MGNLVSTHINEILFAVTVIIGMIAHYGKKYYKAETTVTAKEWFGSSNLPGSIASIGTAIAVIVTALSNGVITESMTVWSVIYTGFVTGFAVDSSTNKDQDSVNRGTIIKEAKLIE